MLELFVIGGLGFWGLIIFEICLLLFFVEKESGTWATISLVIFGMVLQWGIGVDIIGYVKNNIPFILCCVVGYFICGAIWGVTKWWLFCRKNIESYELARTLFLRYHKLPSDTKEIPANLKKEWKEAVENSGRRRSNGFFIEEYISTYSPKVSDHKSQIIHWMTFWIFSLVWTFIADFVKGLFRKLYYMLAGYLQRISDGMWAKMRDDLKEDTQDDGK